MKFNRHRTLLLVAVAAAATFTAGVNAQDSSSSAASAPAASPSLHFPWKIGPMAVTGFVDGFYTYNANNPAFSFNKQSNDLYNFNDKANEINLSAAKLTLNHDPAPIGARFDFIYGRTNYLVNYGLQGNYIQQAYISLKPARMKGFEADFGKFVTAAGAEVIEAKDNWNYSRSILFSWAIPYYHTGVRMSMPVSKSETVGVQFVNGWNSVTKNNGWVTVGLTSSFVKPKYTWNTNLYTGPQHAASTGGYRNVIDTTLLLTPTSKFNAYINYDYGQHRDSTVNTWQGIAFAGKQTINSINAVALRYEFFNDANGYSTGTKQHLNEVTGTYEFRVPKLTQTVISRFEYRRDMSNQPFFHKDAGTLLDNQSTFSVGLIAVFAPHQ